MHIAASRPGRSEPTRYCSILLAALVCAWLGTVAATPGQGTASQLPELLENQGWQRQADDDGSIYYHPPQQAAAAEQAEENVASDQGEVDIPRLLLERGWRIETNARGDMLLIPVRPPTPPDIDQMLRERGWRMLTDVDGNTLLMPLAPAATGQTAAVPVEEPAAPALTGVDQPAAQFRRALEEKGWRVLGGPDGSMMVYPPTSASMAQPPREAFDSNGYCAGITLAGEEIERPIDSEEKAGRLAGAWIAQFGLAGDEVGALRALNRVFVVSIVESVPPHSLRNQLVIREDGSIIALY